MDKAKNAREMLAAARKEREILKQNCREEQGYWRYRLMRQRQLIRDLQKCVAELSDSE